jgi:hypothetical protein
MKKATPVKRKSKPNSTAPRPGLFTRIIYQAALAAMPAGFALWLLGMSASNYLTAISGLLFVIGGAFLSQDNAHPAHPDYQPLDSQ